MIARDGEGPAGRGRDRGLTVIVPTRNRCALLGRLLESLEGERRDLEEIVVVVNATHDDTLAVLERNHRLGSWLRVLHRTSPGKSGALNHAVAACRGEYLAFVDDDVIVRPGWAAAYLRAFRETDCAALQGRILMPASVQDDVLLMRHVRRFRTHVLVDYGATRRTRRSLTGANMAVRRAVLEHAGPFDERLGPGAAGLCEDTDLAWRLLALGGRIEYVPEAAVEHHFHRARISESYFEEYFHKLGRSRWFMKGCPSALRVLPDYVLAHMREAWSSVSGNADRRFLCRARRLHYSAMLTSSRYSCSRAGAIHGDRVEALS